MRSSFQNLSFAVMLSSSWRRFLIAFSAGAVGALALAPVGFYPALIVPMSLAVWLIDGGRRAPMGGKSSSIIGSSWSILLDGWFMGFGYFLAGLWWLGAAFFVEADKFGLLSPLAVIGLPAFLGTFFALGFFVAQSIWSQGPLRVAALAFGLGLSEWLRSVVLTGFPWNNLGMSLASDVFFSQSASIVGLHGLTVIAIFVAAAPSTIADPDSRKSSRFFAAVICFFAAMGSFGYLRLASSEQRYESDVFFRIVQSNTSQGAKFRPEAMNAILEKHIRMSIGDKVNDVASLERISHFIWPESPFPLPLASNPDHLSAIGRFLPPNANLITGAIRMDLSNPVPRFYNSIHVVTAPGHIIANYDKAHLVPFGEYLPLAALLDRLGLRQFVNVPGGFSVAENRALLRIPGLAPVAALICYEAIFPGVISAGSERPGLLLNVTNDAWFGMTPGPHQHLSQARLRAVEEGLPLIRAANSGISAIIDPYGRIVSSLPLGTEGVLDGPLPAPLTPTFFARSPWLGALLLLLAVLVLAIASRRWL